MKKVITIEVLVEALPDWESGVMPVQAIHEFESELLSAVRDTSHDLPRPWVMQAHITDRRSA
jgi:hypothetical protein